MWSGVKKYLVGGVLLSVSLGGCGHIGDMVPGGGFLAGLFGGGSGDLDGYRRHAAPEVVGAIDAASRRTGVPVRYLLATAAQESGFRPDARAPNGSAVGLFQFIESTWLSSVKRYGPEHGLAVVAAEIRIDRQGCPSVVDPARRRHVLGLRGDPRLSALMAAELARENRARLERALGRRVEAVDLYMAHFLGTRGATELLRALKHTPDAPGPSLLPAAARANRSVFYDGGPHRPRSLRQIFTVVAARMERA